VIRENLLFIKSSNFGRIFCGVIEIWKANENISLGDSQKYPDDDSNSFNFLHLPTKHENSFNTYQQRMP
jgi:hypothetical protein